MIEELLRLLKERLSSAGYKIKANSVRSATDSDSVYYHLLTLGFDTMKLDRLITVHSDHIVCSFHDYISDAHDFENDIVFKFAELDVDRVLELLKMSIMD